MGEMKNEKDDIINYKVFSDFILLLFGDGSLRKLDKQSLINSDDYHTLRIKMCGQQPKPTWGQSTGLDTRYLDNPMQ